MAITAGLSFLAGLFWLGAIGGLVLAGLNVSRGRLARPGILLFILGLVGGSLLTGVSQGLVLVQPNERAVVFRQIGGTGEGALRAEPLQPGLKWIIPFVDAAIIYPVNRQEVTMAGSPGEATGGSGIVLSGVRGRRNDGQEIVIDVTVLYTINPVDVNQIHRSWRDTYENAFIVSQTRSLLRDGIGNFSAEALYAGGRAELQAQAIESLTSKLEIEGFVLVDVLIRDVTFSSEFAAAIERKQIAEQEAERAVFLVQQQEQEADRAREEARGLADATVIRATGDADAVVIRAVAEAEALRLINVQITQNPALIQFKYIQELGDNVRLILIPSNSPFLFDIQGLVAQTGAASVPASAPAEATGEGQ